MNDKLENNKLDDSNLEKVSGGEGNSEGVPQPLYKPHAKVYCRGCDRELFFVIGSSYMLGLGWKYVIRSCTENKSISDVKEEDLSYGYIS